MSDKDDDVDIGEAVDSVANAVDKISRLAENFGVADKNPMTSGNEHSIDPPEPIVEAHVDEDKVLIVAERGGDELNKLGVNFKDEKLELIMGDETVHVSVPDDIDEDSIEADMKNGVLRVSIDRIQKEEEPDTEYDFEEKDWDVGEKDEIDEDDDGGEE